MFDIQIIKNKMDKLNLPDNIDIFNPSEIDEPLNEYGQTWLHFASYYGNIQDVQMFINKSADVRIKDIFGHTAMHYAAIKGNKEIGELLISKWPILNSATKNGDTILHYSCLSGHIAFIQFILEHDKKLLQMVNKDHLSALHYAIATNQYESAILLLDQGIKINELNDRGYSVLHVSSAVGNMQITTNLITTQEGKNIINLEDQVLKWTPINFAKLAQNTEIIELLKKYGAIDTNPFFTYKTITEIVYTAKTYICNPEEFTSLTTTSTLAVTGVALNNAVGIARWNNNVAYYFGYGALAAINYSIIKALTQKFISNPIAKSEIYESYRNNYCADILLNINDSRQIVSLRHAEKYLSNHQEDYIILGSKCKNNDDRLIIKFDDLGFTWGVCDVTLGVISNINQHEEL